MDVLKQSVTQAPAAASPGPGIGHRLTRWIAALHAGQLVILCLGILGVWGLAILGAMTLADAVTAAGGRGYLVASWGFVVTLLVPLAAPAALWVWFGARRTP